jgi:hypothetical protein
MKWSPAVHYVRSLLTCLEESIHVLSPDTTTAACPHATAAVGPPPMGMPPGMRPGMPPPGGPMGMHPGVR